MNIVAKMQEVESNFNGLRDQAIQITADIKTIQDEANKEIQNRQQQIQLINEEMNRVQGEHRLLVEMGKEQGVLDENGIPVQVPVADAAAEA